MSGACSRDQTGQLWNFASDSNAKNGWTGDYSDVLAPRPEESELVPLKANVSSYAGAASFETAVLVCDAAVLI